MPSPSLTSISCITQAQQISGDSSSYPSPQQFKQTLNTYSAAAQPPLPPLPYDPFNSPQRPLRQVSTSAQQSPYGALFPAPGSARQYGSTAAGGSGLGTPGGSYRRPSYSSHIPDVPEDAPFPPPGRGERAGNRTAQLGLGRHLRRNSDAVSIPDPADWDPLYRCDILGLGVIDENPAFPC